MSNVPYTGRPDKELPTDNADPEPEDSTGLEPGGGVPPGETPPDSGTVNAGPTAAGSGKRTITPWVIVGVVVLLVLMFVLFFVFRVVDLTN